MTQHLHLHEVSKKQDTTNIILKTALYSLLSQEGLLRIRGTFKSDILYSLTTKHMLASARKQEAEHLEYSNPQTLTPAPKGPHA